MKTFTNLFRVGFIGCILMGFGVMANAQTTYTLTVTNYTSCDLQFASAGSYTGVGCSVPAQINATTVAAGATVTVPYIDNGTGLPVTTPVYNIGIAAYATAPGTWQQANQPLSTTCYAVTSGTSPCGTYNITFSGGTAALH